MQVPKKEILEELRNLAKKLGVSLKDLMFTDSSDIIYMKNSDNVRKNVSNKIITKGNIDKETGLFTSNVTIPDGYKSDKPVEMCFFLEDPDTTQKIEANIKIGDNVDVDFFATCFSLNSEGTHIDTKNINIGKNSNFGLYEFHYNTKDTYLTTITKGNIKVGENSKFINEFIARHGNIGKFKKLINVSLEDNSECELTSKMNLQENDDLHSYNKIDLNGKNSSGLIKSNTVTRDNVNNYFKGILNGKGDNSRGHIECDEILIGDGNIKSLPELKVTNPTSRLTHESAIGTLERTNIDNLLIKGLTEQEAIEFIIKGHLK